MSSTLQDILIIWWPLKSSRKIWFLSSSPL